jgi:hypothetical protein
MNPGIEYYRLGGQPAMVKITIDKLPAAGSAVVIDGVIYTYGTIFWGTTVEQVVQSLTDAINANRSTYAYRHLSTDLIKTHCAAWMGKVIVVMATYPGVDGNSMAISTTDPTSYVLSSATFSGGSDGGSLGGGATIGEGVPNYTPSKDEFYIDSLTGFGYIVWANGDSPARLF